MGDESGGVCVPPSGGRVENTMVKRQDDPERDRAIWQAARDALRAEAARAAPPNEMDVAAYLDGRLEGRALERVEAWMASSEDALDLVMAARESLALGPDQAPVAVIRRARALVGGRAAEQHGGWLERLRSAVRTPLWRPALSAVAAAIFLLVCAGSFELGRQESRSLAQIRAEPADLDGPSLGLDDDIIL